MLAAPLLIHPSTTKTVNTPFSPRRSARPAALFAVVMVLFGCWAMKNVFAGDFRAVRRMATTHESSGAIENATPAELMGVDVVEHLGGQLPLNAEFLDADGKAVKLGDYFDGKRPTLLVFAYHTCPMLCSLVLDAVSRSVEGVAWTVGKQFDVVVVSIDPRDTPGSAAKKRAQVAQKYTRGKGSTAGWHFLVGNYAAVSKVTETVGFQYRFDAEKQEYAHPAAIYLTTPAGKLARYLYGIEFSPKDVTFGLYEASEGRTLSAGEKLLMYCYHYDPKGKKYVPLAMNIMRLGGGATALSLGGLLAVLSLRERRIRVKSARPPTPKKAPKNAEEKHSP